VQAMPRVFDFNSALVRGTRKSVVNGLRAIAGPTLSSRLSALNTRATVAALRAAGVQVTVLDALEQFPDSIFVEDPALVFSQAAYCCDPERRAGWPKRRSCQGCSQRDSLKFCN